MVTRDVLATQGAMDEDMADYERELLNQTARNRRDVRRKRIAIHLLCDLRESFLHAVGTL